MKSLTKVTIIGVGLIGGSYAKALKKTGLIERVVGYGIDKAALQTAKKLAVIDEYQLDIEEAVKSADLVMLAVPMGAMPTVLQSLKPFLDANTVLTDAGSSKASIVDAIENIFGRKLPNFVAGHPIAGKEQSGVEAACENLFNQHKVILTPTAETDVNAIKLVQSTWEVMGANVSTMTPEYHDEVLAATSHLPHLLAFGLVDLLNDHEELGNVFQYTAGGFKDFTRIASSDATMWRDIALNNRIAIIKWLKHYQAEIDQIVEDIENENGDALYQRFNQAKCARDDHYCQSVDKK